MTSRLTILQCKDFLNFAPIKSWDRRLPAFAWNSILLCGFDLPPTHPVVELMALNPDFVQTLAAVHPALSFMEICRVLGRISTALVADFELAEKTQKAPIPSSLSDRILNAYHFRPSADLQRMHVIVNAMPITLQNFVADKMITPGELAPLRSLSGHEVSLQALFSVWSEVVEARASRQVAIKILELLVDLNAAENSAPVRRDEAELAERWLKRLQSLRFPQATQRDQRRAQALKEIPWPLKTQAQFERVGDEMNLHLSLRAISSPDLKKKLEQLAELYQTSTEQMERSWNPHSSNK